MLSQDWRANASAYSDSLSGARPVAFRNACGDWRRAAGKRLLLETDGAKFRAPYGLGQYGRSAVSLGIVPARSYPGKMVCRGGPGGWRSFLAYGEACRAIAC